MRWTDYMDADGRDGSREDKFGSEGQEAQAANRNQMHYSPGADENETGPQNGAIAAERSGVNTQRNREATDYQGFSTNHSATTEPGPGTATDRGYGNVGNNAYGTGVGDTDLGSNAGLDEQDINNNNTVTGDTGSDLAGGALDHNSERR